MIKVNFFYEGKKITIQSTKCEVMKEIFKKFERKCNIIQ